MGYLKTADAVAACGRSYVEMTCSKGESYFKIITCGFPACETCSKKRSVAETRRVEAVRPKLARAAGLYRLVLTLPPAVRERLFEPARPGEFRTVERRRQVRGKERVTTTRVPDDHFDAALYSRLFRLAGRFGLDVGGTEASYVTFHPIGAAGDYNPHFEVLLPFWDGEWTDPHGCALVREWLIGLPGRWAAALEEDLGAWSLRRLGSVLPRVQVNGKFADTWQRISHRIRYAADYHWARRPTKGRHRAKWALTDRALRFLVVLRRHRLHRGYGRLADRAWRSYVEALPFAHADLERPDRSDVLHLRGCPLHAGRRLRFAEVVPADFVPWSQVSPIAPGVYADRRAAVHLSLLGADP